MIGIIGAMDIEVIQLKEQMDHVQIETISGVDFYKGKLQGKDVVVAVSGIGKVNAAVCTQTMILKYEPVMIINVGVAGGLHGKTNIGDLVIAEAVVMHDNDTTAFGDPNGLVHGLNLVEMKCDAMIIKRFEAVAPELVGTDPLFKESRVVTGIVATGDQFISSKAQFESIYDIFGAIASEMEGGSIGQVCVINQIPFGVVRAISDNGDEASAVSYDSFKQPAANRSVELINAFLKAM